jgi:hypothetical protein
VTSGRSGAVNTVHYTGVLLESQYSNVATIAVCGVVPHVQ